MPDYLSVADWKAKCKAAPAAKDADDLNRPLQDFDRAGNFPDQKAALKAVLDKAKSVKSKNQKNGDAKVKALLDYLDDVVSAAEKKAAEVDKAVVAEAKAKGDDEKVDADLVKQLLLVRKLGVDKARFFVLAMGKPAGLAIAKARITKKHKQQAREWRKGKGKLLLGTVYGEGGKYIFDFGEDKPPGGLAALIKRGVLAQAGKPIKLKVRGGGDELDDETDLAELLDLGEDSPDLPDPEGLPDDDDDDEAEGEADADDDPDGLADEWRARLAELEPEATRRLRENIGDVSKIRVVLGFARGKADEGDHAAALKGLKTLETLLGAAGASPSMAAWQSAREDAVGQLRQVAAAVAATKDPDAKAVIVEIQSIIKNLTPSPSTPESVAELERYLRDDDVIAAAEEVPPQIGTLTIREPLLRALATLKS